VTLASLRQAFLAIPGAVYFFAVTLLFIGWWVARTLRAYKRRAAQVQHWCETRSFEYTRGPVPASSLAPMYVLTAQEQPLPAALGPGSGRVASVNAECVARGMRAGVPLWVFDETRVHRSDNGRGRTRWTSRYRTWVLFELAACNLPRLVLLALSNKGPASFGEGLLGAVASLGDRFTTDGLELSRFEGQPGLLLRSNDPARAHALIEPLVGFFDERRGWGIEAEGPWLLVGCEPQLVGEGWYRRPLMDFVAVEKYDDLVDNAIAVAERLRAAASAR
jgi:hypothetical protein